jgi:hypothetical protein
MEQLRTSFKKGDSALLREQRRLLLADAVDDIETLQQALAISEKARKDASEDAMGTEIVKRMRGLFVTLGLGEWTEWADALTRMADAVRAQTALAAAASQRYDALLQADRDKIDLQIERDVLKKRVDALEKALRDVVDGNDLACTRHHDIGKNWPNSDFRRQAIAALAPQPTEPAS